MTTVTIIARMRVQHAKASFAGYAVEFKVLSISSFNSMLVTDGIIRYSEPVRTLLDFAYFGARHARSDEYEKCGCRNSSKRTKTTRGTSQTITV